MFMQPKRGGLFGSRPPWATPGIGDGHREQIGRPPLGTPGMGVPMEAEPPRKLGLGSRLFGQGWEDKAMAIGGILQGDGGAAYREMQQNKLAPLMEQQKREAERAEWQWRKQWERDNPAPEANPYRTEDNAGNVWEMGADGQFKPIFVDPNDKQFIQDGQLVTVPNRVRSQREAPAGPVVGAVVNGHRFKGGDPNNPASWEAAGGAAVPASPPFGGNLDPLKGPGTVTSMRRTPEGNRSVGGVANSRHLTGEAVDVVGATPAQLRAYYGPDAKIGWHKNHHHIVKPGAQFPYYGKRGTKGLKR